MNHGPTPAPFPPSQNRFSRPLGHEFGSFRGRRVDGAPPRSRWWIRGPAPKPDRAANASFLEQSTAVPTERSRRTQGDSPRLRPPPALPAPRPRPKHRRRGRRFLRLRRRRPRDGRDRDGPQHVLLRGGRRVSGALRSEPRPRVRMRSAPRASDSRARGGDPRVVGDGRVLAAGPPAARGPLRPQSRPLRRSGEGARSHLRSACPRRTSTRPRAPRHGERERHASIASHPGRGCPARPVLRRSHLRRTVPASSPPHGAR